MGTINIILKTTNFILLCLLFLCVLPLQVGAHERSKHVSKSQVEKKDCQAYKNLIDEKTDPLIKAALLIQCKKIKAKK